MSVLGPFCPDATAPPPSDQTPATVNAVRVSSLSIRYDPRSLQVCVVLLGLIAAVSLWSLSVGDFPVPLSDVVASLQGKSTGDSDFVLRTLRMPRILTGIGVGAAFGLAGALFQSLVRNPLGSPDVIGFTSGASLGAVISIIYFGAGAWAVSLSALAGGLLTALLVFLFAWRNGVKSYRLVLVGIGAAYATAAGVDFALTRGEITDVQRATVWLTGSLNGRTWSDVAIVWIALALFVPVVSLAQQLLNRLELGDETAAALGVSVNPAKLGLVIAGVGLAALGVAAAGPIAFVAFVSGPIARRLCRTGGAALGPSALVGALIVVIADLAARRLFAPVELPVGVMTAVVGAPYLLWQLRQQSKTGSL